MSLTRRHLLGLGGMAFAASVVGVGACSRAAPAGYFVSSVPFPVTVVVGEALARLDVPFNP